MTKKKATPRRKRPVPKPGQFVYGGGMVFEMDNNGRQRARRDLQPSTQGTFKHKFYTPPTKRR